jgi:hypothetical protein
MNVLVVAGYRDLLRELKTVLGRQDPEPEKDEDLRELVHRLLRDKAIESAWVCVLDDLPPPSDEDLQEHRLEWLLCSDQRGFPWRSGKTIVTSRFRTWVDKQGFGQSFEVGNLEEEEAHALLQDKLEHWREDAEGVTAVARRLCYFPLALASAVGCARKFHLSPSEYLKELDRRRESKILVAWGLFKRAQDEYPYEPFEVLHDVWRRLTEGREGEAVTTLLRKLAFLDPCDIPVETFGDFRVLLPILEEHCLVSVSKKASGDKAGSLLVSIHALTQQVVREHFLGNAQKQVVAEVTQALAAQMDMFDEHKELTQALAALMDTFDEHNAATYTACTCRAFLPHVWALQRHVGDSDPAWLGSACMARLALRTARCLFATCKVVAVIRT